MDGSLVLAAISGAAGGVLLLGGRALSMSLDPRPCWQKQSCSLRRADPEACQSCAVYVYRDVPAEEFVVQELGLPPLRAFGTESAEAA